MTHGFPKCSSVWDTLSRSSWSLSKHQMVQSYFGKRKKVGFWFFFPQSEKDSKTLVSSEIRPGWEPSYYKAKLKTLEAFIMTGRLRVKKVMVISRYWRTIWLCHQRRWDQNSGVAFGD